MKLYVKSDRDTKFNLARYHDLMEFCERIQSIIYKKLHELYPNIDWWDGFCKDNKDGTVKIRFMTPMYISEYNKNAGKVIFSSFKEAKAAVEAAVAQCPAEIRDNVVKITCGGSGDRFGPCVTLSVVFKPSTNDYYSIPTN